MRILFVYANMYSLGGIQTLLLRYSRQLSSMGHEVHLLTRSPAPPTDVTMAIVDEFARHGRVHVAEQGYASALGSVRRADIPAAEVIVGCNVESSLLGALVQAKLMPQARLVVGAFAAREYCWKVRSWQRRWDQRLIERLMRTVPLSNVFFSTDAMARVTGACLGRDFSDSAVIPLAIDTEVPPRAERPPPGPMRVVSVARLDRYYIHHWHMVGVVSELRREGLEIEYHVHGDGPGREDLADEIRAHGVGDAVFLHGSLPYPEFGAAVEQAFAFIGLGTALIEAGVREVPALVGIAHDPDPLTYGFLGETTGNDLGGRIDGVPEYSIADKLRWLAAADERQYAEVAQACRHMAREFGIGSIAPDLVDVLRSALPYSLRLSPMSRALGRIDPLVGRVMVRLGLSAPAAARYVPADAAAWESLG